MRRARGIGVTPVSSLRERRVKSDPSYGAPTGHNRMTNTMPDKPTAAFVSQADSLHEAANASVGHDRMFTARAATRAIVRSEMIDSNIISSFARGDRGSVSVGENAVAFVKLK